MPRYADRGGIDYWIVLRGTIEKIHEEGQEVEPYDTPRMLCFTLEGIAVRCNIQGASQGESFPLEAGDNVVILGERLQQGARRWCHAKLVQWPDRHLLYLASKGDPDSLRGETPEGIREDIQIGFVQVALIAGFLAYLRAPGWVWVSTSLAVFALMLYLEGQVWKKVTITDTADTGKEMFPANIFEGIGTVELIDGEDAIFSYREPGITNTQNRSFILPRVASS